MRLPTLITLFLLATIAQAAPKGDDGSAPRAALLMYDKLVGPNEADKALPLYYATTTRERALAAVLANCDGALANLRKKAADKYTPEIADAMLHSLDATTAEDINAAKIEVMGDKALVTFPNSTRPTIMTKVKSEWKISVKAIAQDVQDNPRNFRKSFTRLATLVNQTADKISQGQYADPEEASKKLIEGYKALFASADQK